MDSKTETTVAGTGMEEAVNRSLGNGIEIALG